MLKQWFSTPKRTAAAVICLFVLFAVTGIGIAFAAGKVRESSSIGEEKARYFAFADAGVDPLSAKKVHSEFGHEQGHFVYEVEFVADNTEYEYWIKAEDGSVVKKQMEVMDFGGADIATADRREAGDAALSESKDAKEQGKDGFSDEETQPAARTTGGKVSDERTSGGEIAGASQAATGKNNTETEGTSPYIGIDKAKAIALEHAGFSETEVSFSKAKLENDDGFTVYEVEFYKDGLEYEYQIHAASGEIMGYDVDRED